MAARAEAEAARRWARYAEDVGPDEDEMPDVGGDGEQDSDADELEDPQVHIHGEQRPVGTSHPKLNLSEADLLSLCIPEHWLWARIGRGQCMVSLGT